MTFFKLLLRNLLYHWRGNVAVLLGIALGSAVLTGALLVGDSLRGSLQSLSLDQLGWVENALAPGRFFRAALADDLAIEKRSAVLLLQGGASRADAPRVGKVTVLGIDASFWPDAKMPLDTSFWMSEERGAVLNQTLANALDAKVGDAITLHLERADAAPREMLLAQRKAEAVIEPIRVTIKQIIADEGMGRFSHKPSPLPPRNAFVPIKLLQQRLDLAGRANVILAASAPATLQGKLTLDDWGLRYRSPKDRAEAFVRYLAPNENDGQLKKARWIDRVPEELAKIAEMNGNVLTRDAVVAYYEQQRDYYVLESQRMVLEPQVVNAMNRLVGDVGDKDDKAVRWNLTPILVYLADSLSSGKLEVPYVIVAGENTKAPRKDGKLDYVLADDQVRLMRWPGSPFKLQTGAPLTIAYFSPDERNHLANKTAEFKVAAIDDIAGMYDDPDKTPEFKGITDKLDMSNWENPPFPFDNKRIKEPDKDFWKRYRSTPRAYINLRKAQELWKTRFGELTSFQVRFGKESPKFLPKYLLDELKAEQGGFVFQPVREQAIRASAGTTDFGLYFLYFSFFLIVAALLLVGLLVRLNLDRRAGEMGLLLATGWDHRRVRRLLLAEGTVLAIVGALLGLGGALLYAHGMLQLLVANWPGGEALHFLRLHAEPLSFAIGYATSFLVSVFTLWWATRAMSKLSPLALLRGETIAAPAVTREKRGHAPAIAVVAVLLAGVMIVIGFRVDSHEVQAGMFFGSGALFLTAALAAIWVELQYLRHQTAPRPSLVGLSFRNAGRQAARSVLTVGLLASASFLIVAVESFHKDTDRQFHEKTGGSGGFAFYAEGAIPVFEDLNQPKVRRERGLDIAETRRLQYFPCRVQPGDDASCLGLYKPLKPRVMGVSAALINRGGFSFAISKAATDDEKANPWLLLNADAGDEIPAIIDKNTSDWILKVGVGGTLDTVNERGQTVKLRIVALLKESIFQSEIIISEKSFLKLYPQQTGFSFFLIDAGETDPEKLKIVEKQLAKSLEDFGLDVQTTASRLQGYLAVENMYLATFQALGGLGLMLGAAGLAIVLLRGVWERRAELALLSALGFRSGQLALLVLVENAILLALGLAAGTVSALLAVAPHLVGAGAQVLWLRIAGLLTLVLAVGLVSATLAVWSTLKTPVLTALRRE